jgi:hypothetical protein
MPSNNQRNNELEFTPTFGTQQLKLDFIILNDMEVTPEES